LFYDVVVNDATLGAFVEGIVPKAYSVFSKAPATADAVVELARQLREHPPATPSTSVAFVFCSRHHAENAEALSASLHDILAPLPFVGWVGHAAICGMHLNEDTPGISVLVLDDVGAFVQTAPTADLVAQTAAQLVADAPHGQLRVLAAPVAGFDAANFFPPVDEQMSPVVGGLSGVSPHDAGPLLPGVAQGEYAMVSLDGARGLIGVAQGAQLLGPVHTVTKSDGSRVDELDGQRALHVLRQEVPEGTADHLQQLWPRLFAAVVSDDEQVFTMRPLAGVLPADGALLTASTLPPRSQVALAMRDGEAARTDLEETLHSMRKQLGQQRPLAVLVFAHQARDRGLFDVEGYDAERISDVFGDDVPTVGVLTPGEVATVGAHTQLLGQSAVICALVAS